MRLQPSYLQLLVVVAFVGEGWWGVNGNRGQGAEVVRPPVIDDLRDTLSSSVDPFLALAPGFFSVVGCYFYGRALKIFFFKLNLMKGVSKENGKW